MRKTICLVLLSLFLFACSSSKIVITHSSQNDVYYEIFVGSYYDTNKDGMGDLNGVTEKLDYLYSMGVGGIWLMPINPSPSYHKYDVTDYEQIDSKYGTLVDFDALIKKADILKIDVIIDLVLNHTSSDHPWFIAAKQNMLDKTCAKLTSYCDYYNFSSTPQAAYYPIGNGINYEARFWSGMPDLNLDSDNVRREIKKIVAFWLDKGVKGFRLDAVTSYYNQDVKKNTTFLTWLTQTVKELDPQAYLVGEAWTNETDIMTLYQSQIDSLFHFQFSQPEGKIATSIRLKTGQELAIKVVSYLNEARAINPNVLDALFLSNHDQGRSAAYFAEAEIEKLKLMASIYLLMPGKSYIYYGEEISLRGSGIDQNKRLPMIWDSKDITGQTNPPTGANYTWKYTAGVKQALADQNSLLNHYRRVISIKNTYDVITNGTVEALILDPEVYAVKSSSATQSVIVIHNLSNTIKTVSYDFSSYKIANQIMNYKQKAVRLTSTEIIIGAYNSVILVLK